MLLDRFAVLNTVFWVAVFVDLGWDTVFLLDLNALLGLMTTSASNAHPTGQNARLYHQPTKRVSGSGLMILTL